MVQVDGVKTPEGQARLPVSAQNSRRKGEDGEEQTPQVMAEAAFVKFLSHELPMLAGPVPKASLHQETINVCSSGGALSVPGPFSVCSL